MIRKIPVSPPAPGKGSGISQLITKGGVTSRVCPCRSANFSRCRAFDNRLTARRRNSNPLRTIVTDRAWLAAVPLGTSVGGGERDAARELREWVADDDDEEEPAA